jgi:hypothetical protein
MYRFADSMHLNYFRGGRFRRARTYVCSFLSMHLNSPNCLNKSSLSVVKEAGGRAVIEVLRLSWSDRLMMTVQCDFNENGYMPKR